MPRGSPARRSGRRRRRPAEERLHEPPVAGVALVREDVVGDDDRARPATGRSTCGRRPRRAEQGEVGGHDGGDDVDDDDDVDVTQPAAGAHPGVGAGPREHAQGPRERLDVGAAAGDGLLPRVERRRVEVAPRHERDLVPGLGELVREGRRVGGDAALVGVRRTDERDLERGARRRRTASRRRPSGHRDWCQTPSLDLTTRSESRARRRS